MRVLLLTCDSRGGVEPLLALAVRLRELGAEVRLCAPPDCAERVAELGVQMVPVGEPTRSLVHGAKRPTPADVPRIAAELMTTYLDAATRAAEGCDVMVASGLLPVMASAHSVADKLGIRFVAAAYCPIYLPSPHQRPTPLPGRPLPPDVTDNRVLWDLNAQNANDLFADALNVRRASLGLPPLDDVYGYAFTTNPLLAADPILGPWMGPSEIDVVQTGAWILPDDRPLPAELEAFLAAGTPPVYVGFGSMRAPEDFARLAIEAVRSRGRRVIVSRGWAEFALIDDRDDCLSIGEVNHQALFPRVAAVVHHGGAGTTTAAARAGAPQVVVPQIGDQPYWAGRVATLGIGAAHDGPTPTLESLAAALEAALTPETRERAIAVAAMIQSDGAATAANWVLDLVRDPAPAPVSAPPTR